MDLGLSQATASAFLEAFRRCEPTAADSKYFMAFPALVCAAFSAEVGLKTILKREGKSTHGHDLLSLFMQLSDERKIEISDGTGIAIEEFAAHLNHSKKAFVEWRYIYEEPGEKMISLLFIGKFAAAVEAAGLKMRDAVQHVARQGNATAEGRFAARVAFLSAPTLGIRNLGLSTVSAHSISTTKGKS